MNRIGIGLLAVSFWTILGVSKICANEYQKNISMGLLQKSFSVMTYNLENLFDTVHDKGKEDYAYLPLSVKNSSEEVLTYCRNMRSGYYKERCFNMDWSEAVADQKIYNIAEVIKIADNGRSPDIVVFQEVENLNILTQLVEKSLSEEGYREILLTEGPDKRGIDVAIISKFPLIKKTKYHQIDLSTVYDDSTKVKLTRGVLEASFSIGGKVVSVLANHWPSQRNPDETRVIAAKVMIKAAIEAPGFVIMAGDFNQVDSDNPHAINELMLNPQRTPYFYDVEKVFFGEQLNGHFESSLFSEMLVEHRGTHHYNGRWSSLDRFFVLKDQVSTNCGLFSSCFRPIWSSYKVVKFPFMLHDVTYRDRDTGDEVTYYNVPMRYNVESRDGYSDHLPAIMHFTVN